MEGREKLVIVNPENVLHEEKSDERGFGRTIQI
jgi:hypothetical protein